MYPKHVRVLAAKGLGDVGWIVICDGCKQVLDVHWFNGHADIVLQWLEANEEKGGCRCSVQ